MAYPNVLFYSETGSRVRYTSKPSSRIDFKRAIAGKSDCFVSGISSRLQKPKKLILADWTASNWDEEKKALAQGFLKKLIADGFSIYLWQAGEVKPLTDFNWLNPQSGTDQFDAFKIVTDKITPEFPEKIIKTAVSQQKITKENAFILDKDWFEWLLDFENVSKPLSRGKLKVSDLFSLREEQAELVLDIAKKTNQTIDTLIYDEMSTRVIKAAPILSKVNAQFKDLTYVTLKIDGPEVAAAVSQTPKQYARFHLKTLTVEPPHDPTNLLSLLGSEEFSNIESIDLSGCTQIGGSLSSLKKVELRDPEKLHSVTLTYSNLTSDDLQWLSSATPKPEITNLDGKVSLRYSNITLNDLVAHLSLPTAANLEAIKLPEYNHLIACLYFLKKGALSKLTSVVVGSEKIRYLSDTLKIIRSAAPNISKIDRIDESADVKNESVDQIRTLDKLKNVDLSHSNITAEDLAKLLAAAPNLESIDLTSCKQLAGGLSSLKKGSLSKLEKVFLNGCNLTTEDLAALLSAAPNLTSLEIEKPDPLKAGRNSTSEASNAQSAANNNGKSTNSTQNLDANTKADPNTKFTMNRIFCSTDGEPIPPSKYRLAVFNKLSINQNPCSLNDAFEMSLEHDPTLIPCEAKRSFEDVFDLGKTIEKKEGYSYAYGTNTFELDEQWQAIPSLNASEELLHYHTNPSTASIEIQYSKLHNRYYIRSLDQKQTVSLDFLLKVPIPTNSLPDEIQRLVVFFNSFKPGELKLNPAKTQFNGEDYLNYIVGQEKGACRHRAFAFAKIVQEQHPHIPTRIVTNVSHAFVEVMIGNQWVNCDLGGYPAKLDIKEMDRLKKTDIPISKTNYDAQLQPWRNEKPSSKSLPAYLQALVQPSEKKNRLVQLDSEKSVTAMIGSLQKHCQDTSRPVFYLHSPEEASGLSHYIERKGSTGSLTKGSGNPLAAFLTADYPAGVSPILVVNYSRFNADDIVRLNTMLDPKRSVEDINIPNSVILVGVNNTNDPDCYQGSDFYSRFDSKDSNPVSRRALEKIVTQFPARPSQDAPSNTINLFHASDWKFRLLGGWVLGEGNLVFKEGLLQSALNKGKQITIENGLWDDPEFVFFWQQARLTGRVLGEGGTVFDTKDLKIDTLEGFDWNVLKKGWQINPNFEGEELILNPETLSDYFEGYKISANKKANPSLGFIREAAKKGQEVLNVYVSHNLSADSWAMLLKECQDKKIRLSLRSAPGVNLPGEPPNPLKPQVVAWKPSIQDHTQFIQSSDIDATVAMLTKAKQWEVIDISECSPSDLLLHTKPEFKDDHFEFTETERALLVALNAGKSVILKGNFSEELSCALTPLLLSRLKGKDLKGELILVSNTKENFEFLPNLYSHAVSIADKKSLIQAGNNRVLWAKPLSIINAELQFPGSSKGLLTLENSIKPLPAFNPEKSKEETEKFNQQRKDLIWSVLSKSPYVYIAGLTGVGKSTFIKNEFLKEIPHKLYRGEQDMEAWAQNKSDQLKVIFIDEANLSAKQWSEFEGLFNVPPTILINGELIPLSPQHKVIFAGNPVSYGDERELAPFFTRHQRVIIFEPLPPTVIYEQILKPVFSKKLYTSKTPEICKPMLDVYAFLHGLSTKDVLISPRELQMMALLTASYCEKMPAANPEEVARHYAYQLSKDLVPASKKDAFDSQFKQPPIKSLPLPKPAKNSDFKITQSRLPAANALNELLELRQVRRAIAINDQQKYGGLGGVIFEGEPGVGKSDLVTAMLRAHGYKKIKPDAPKHEKGFYRMKANLSLAEKEDLLIKAFYAGDVVVIDEINSSPMMESLLNDLLNGQEPTSNSPEKPKDPLIKPKPGFMVIGTQNPRTMAGRREISSPLLKRLQSLEIPPYPPVEMMEILTNNLPPSANAAKQELQNLVDAYTRNVALAEKEHRNPPPTFRDIMRLAKGIKAHLPKEEVKIAMPINPPKQKRKTYPGFFNPPPTTATDKSIPWLYSDELTVSGLSVALVAGAASLTILCLGPVGLGILGATAALTLAVALTTLMVTSLLTAFVGLGLIASSDEKEDLLTSPAKTIG